MAASIIHFAGRSLIDPPGFMNSSFARMRALDRGKGISIRGVFPIRSSMEWPIPIRAELQKKNRSAFALSSFRKPAKAFLDALFQDLFFKLAERAWKNP